MSSALNFCFLSTLLQPKRKRSWRKLKSKQKNICEISIIIILTRQKLEPVGPKQPKIKLPLPGQNCPWNVEKF